MKKKITHEHILKTVEDVLKAVNDFSYQTPSRDEMNTRFDEVNDKIDSVEQNLTNEIESVKLRQDNVAYRFELNDLEKRVDKIETKI